MATISRFINKFTDYKDNDSISYKLRKKRFSRFMNLLGVSKKDRIVDIGGAKKIWIGSGLEKNVTIVNISITEKDVDEHGITSLPGDACNLNMFKNNQFDVAFSNSVIEHVGDFSQQKKFSNEIQRIAPKYWVQTPCKYFPIEPHFLFPFFQYLPLKVKHYVGPRWKYSHFKRVGRSNKYIHEQVDCIRLLSNAEMKNLFDDGTLIKETFLGLTKSIMLYKN